MTITKYYKAQLQELHAGRVDKKWGNSGARNFGNQLVGYISKFRRITTVLDFGAGQGTLGQYVTEACPWVKWTSYDPGIPGIDTLPTGKFDLIVSSDVLEHIEPEEIDNVLEWLHEHARMSQYHHIACFEAGARLPDGRLAHLIVEDVHWWKDKFTLPNWDIQFYSDTMKRKRSTWQRSCQIQTDRLG